MFSYWLGSAIVAGPRFLDAIVAETIPPSSNPGIFPAINPLTNSLFFATDLAGMMASPFDTLAKIESDVPVPGPEINPLANPGTAACTCWNLDQSTPRPCSKRAIIAS